MKSPSLQIGSFTFNWGSRTYVMGILNVTPDSFSGDGIIAKGDAVDAAVEQARDFLASGADILDVGGEFTRPGSAPVNADEEMERVIPVIQRIASKIFPKQLFQLIPIKHRLRKKRSRLARISSTMSGACARTMDLRSWRRNIKRQ